MSPLRSLRLPFGGSGSCVAVGIAFRGDHLLVRASDGLWSRSPLPAGFVTPSPTEPNLASSTEAADTLGRALASLDQTGAGFGDAVIALPDRAVRAALDADAGRSGARAARRLRGELIRGLSASSSPGAADRDGRFRFGTLATRSLGQRSLLGAVSGGAVVQQYEAVAQAAGLRARWVDAASLAVLPEWLAEADGAGRRVLLLLHRRHFVLAAARDRRLTGFRMKLRAALDPEPPLLAVRQLAAEDAGAAAPVEVWGDGAEAVAEALRADGHAPGEVRATAAGETRASISPVTERALAALLRRAGARPATLRETPVAAGSAAAA